MAARCGFVAAVLLLAVVCCRGFSEERPTDQKIFVLLDDLSIRSTHGLFFKSLSDRGYELDFKLADDPSLTLQKYGKYLYDAAIIFAPRVEMLGGNLDVSAILEFIDSGHDLILAADIGVSSVVRDIATECGVEFDERADVALIDHANYASSASDIDHSLIVANDVLNCSAILGAAELPAPVLFRGIGTTLNANSDLVVKVLSASPSAFSHNPAVEAKSPPPIYGSDIAMVSVMQARNNARVLISGSLDLFSNRFFRAPVQKAGSATRYPKSGNEQFAVELTKWTFHERGHLRAANVGHHRVGESEEPSVYRITDELEYSLDILEWDGKKWQPYRANDVQMQFYMMSPYVLKTLSHDNQGRYSVSFCVPDVYGVFQLKVQYRRLGYATLDLSRQIPVRPFRHNEYERFILSAWPYYTSSFSMMVGFFVFGIAFAYHK
ncbi:hypothetical protein CBR_g28880 [Chara braunii]|uniref:Dolichyl-diphosphooligosaccharide--protein glycosyltransferase 48 kDa subunit n=1 Tax=Chara braunii TaxID=69332 RepID=A0A388LA55_CHABU|nr:hypothetical protein CBR_g28880 [Chara braunii]|eukprot:GBG79164.1 hypothetical protein CBR_g28880 [Chara braunii]